MKRTDTGNTQRKPCKHTEIEMTGEEKKIFSSTDSAVVEA